MVGGTGGGILALPFAFRSASLVVGSIIVAGVTLATILSIEPLVQLSASKGYKEYAEISGGRRAGRGRRAREGGVMRGGAWWCVVVVCVCARAGGSASANICDGLVSENPARASSVDGPSTSCSSGGGGRRGDVHPVRGDLEPLHPR